MTGNLTVDDSSYRIPRCLIAYIKYSLALDDTRLQGWNYGKRDGEFSVLSTFLRKRNLLTFLFQNRGRSKEHRYKTNG